MNEPQVLYDIIMDFIEANPEMPLLEIFGIFEIIKLQYRDQMENEIEGIDDRED